MTPIGSTPLPGSFREVLRRVLQHVLLLLEPGERVEQLPRSTPASGGALWPEERPMDAPASPGRIVDERLSTGRRAR